MSQKIIWDERAIEQFEKLDLFLQKRIIKKIEQISENFSFHNIKKVQGTEKYRLRVGEYRVLFGVLGKTVRILKVGHRKNIYKR